MSKEGYGYDKGSMSVVPQLRLKLQSLCPMSEPPRTHVFSLDSALRVLLSEASQPETLNLSASQSCFAISGSFANTQNLSQCWNSEAISEVSVPAFIHSGLSTQQATELTVVDPVVATPSERTEHASPGLDTWHSHVYATSDTCQHVFCHGRYILLPLIFYLLRHVTVGYFTWYE